MSFPRISNSLFLDVWMIDIKKSTCSSNSHWVIDENISLCYWHMKWEMNHKNKRENSKIHWNTDGNPGFKNVSNHWGKIDFLITCGGQPDRNLVKEKLNKCLAQYTRVNFKWTTDKK